MHIGDTAIRQRPAVLIVIFLFTVLPLYYASWHFRSSQQHNSSAKYAPYWEDGFVDEWLETSVIEPFDNSALRQYCKLSTWRPNLVFKLADANGGIGNIRGNVLDFLLYAIEAGASIILPDRATRNDQNLQDVWSGRAAFDTFFDEDWFLQVMNVSCPQMAIYKSAQQSIAAQYEPKSRKMYSQLELTKAAYLSDLDQWLQSQGDYKGDNMTVVSLGRTLWNFDTRGQPYGLRRVMGQVLRVHPDIRRFAAVVIQQMASRYRLDINPQDIVPKNMFLGAHLRTESDASAAGWLNAPNTNFTAQTDAYMYLAIKNKLSIIYVASGDASELERFKEKASQHRPPLNITTKYDLLDEEQLTEFKQLSWDQQALVDYEVLQRCSVFGGFVRSSFSYNIALTRNQWLEDHGIIKDPWFVLHSEEAVAFDDGFSRIIGRDELHESLIPRGMWP